MQKIFKYMCNNCEIIKRNLSINKIFKNVLKNYEFCAIIGIVRKKFKLW